MLAAILPGGNQAWFFKIVGPIAEIDKHADEINDFFKKLTVENGQGKWTLPEGWQEKPGTPPRLATIVIPADGQPLEMTVNALPWSGSQEDVLGNVNRWRDQLKLGPISAGELPTVLTETKSGEQTVSVVDLRGQFSAPNMTAPFAGGPFAGGQPQGGTNPSSAPGGDLPAGHPPIDVSQSPPAEAPAVPRDDAPKFETPASWTELPASGMRKAAFDIADGDKKALVTVIDFNANAGPLIADPRTNVNRWRKEVGLPEVDEKSLNTAVEKIEIDGQPAIYAAMIPDPSQPEQSQAREATLGAMVTAGGRIWFVKLKGDRDLVAGQQDAFKSFLKSLKLPE
jgi:hypothetical protein